MTLMAYEPGMSRQSWPKRTGDKIAGVTEETN